MRIYIFFFISIFFLFSSSCRDNRQEYINYINTFIGSAPAETEGADDHIEAVNEILGQTIPAVQVPHGMNSWTPQTRLSEKKCISPYYYNDTTFYGFRASHWINGGCAQDYASTTIMGLTGKRVFHSDGRVARYEHIDEQATPAYYSVFLPQYALKSELTATCRAAIMKFTSQKSDTLFIIATPNNDRGEGYVEIDVDKRQIRGYNPAHRLYRATGKRTGFSGYFVVEFERLPECFGVYDRENTYQEYKELKNKFDLGAYVGFAVKQGETILAKCGTSFTSLEEAEKNLHTEIPHWNFEKIKSAAELCWNEHLSSIEVNTPKTEDKELFYSAFYRASLLPRTYSDVLGTYPAFGGNARTERVETGTIYYDDFSTWDIYRAQMPLLTLTQPDRIADFIYSFIKKYEQGGWLPIFPCWNSYTSAMIGDHLIAVIGDAYMKGIDIADIDKAYEAMRKNAFETPDNVNDYIDGKGRRALNSYIQYGYIPLEDPVKEAFHKQEQVSRTLEYAYNDFVLSRIALKLGKTDDYNILHNRAFNYRNVIDPVSGYARGRYADGTFIDTFNPFKNQSYITEGYPCHYTWYAPQDPCGLMEAMGGEERFTAKLDSLFELNLYWHGNEPSHQIAYLYNWTKEPWKAQKNIAQIIRKEYKNHIGGLAGNDDAGQMSAWYVFSAIGFYPVCPGTNQYVIGTPKHPETVLHLNNGKTFAVQAPDVNETNIYIQFAKLNGKPYTKNYLEHQDILAGGVLELVMGSQPSTWGNGSANKPFSLSEE